MLTREEFDRHIEGFHPEWVRSLWGELDAIARAGLEAEGDALTKIRNGVEGLQKLLAAPVPQARSVLRRLQARVTTAYEILDEYGNVNWGFQIAGSFRGLAQGWLLLAPAEWGEAEATAPPLPDQVCAGTVVPGEGVEPSYVSRRSGF